MSGRPRLTPEQRAALQDEALARATQSPSMANWPAIFEGFMAKGIPEADIRPRENVFTFNAWKALGRHVRKGEHGVKVTTWIPTKKTVRDEAGVESTEERSYCSSAYVFHVSQTDARVAR